VRFFLDARLLNGLFRICHPAWVSLGLYSFGFEQLPFSIILVLRSTETTFRSVLLIRTRLVFAYYGAYFNIYNVCGDLIIVKRSLTTAALALGTVMLFGAPALGFAATTDTTTTDTTTAATPPKIVTVYPAPVVVVPARIVTVPVAVAPPTTTEHSSSSSTSNDASPGGNTTTEHSSSSKTTND
jgi:hypothetical protein